MILIRKIKIFKKTTSIYANSMEQQNYSKSVATTFPAKLIPAPQYLTYLKNGYDLLFN